MACKHCGAPVGWELEEAGYDLCDWCADIEVERFRKRAEWDHYHDEPCPESELPPYSKMED